MTRERIEDFREIVLPFVRNVLLKTNYENLGKSDAEEFTRDFNEILDLAIKALEQEPCVSRQVVNELFDSEIKMYKERIETRKGSNYHDETERIKEFRSRIANAEYWQNKIKALPPATPTRKKRKWELVQRGKCIDICCSNCKATRIKEYAYNYTIDRLDKEDVKECLESDDMRYCPYCGSDNREAEE